LHAGAHDDSRRVRKIAFWLLAIAGDLPLLIILAIGTGMRPEELLGLRWKHVNLKLGPLICR